jgi:glucose uptake protein GlcU
MQEYSMRNWLPTAIGFLLGAIAGYPLQMLAMGDESSIHIFLSPVFWASGVLRRIFMPQSDPMAELFFLLPLAILYCAILGTIIGFLSQLLFFTKTSENKKPSS